MSFDPDWMPQPPPRKISEMPEPFDPKCGRTPDQISEYSQEMTGSSLSPAEYVKREEGTFNPENGHFLCTTCYIAVGMPTAPGGWVCP